jgi:hypothetical protein
VDEIGRGVARLHRPAQRDERAAHRRARLVVETLSAMPRQPALDADPRREDLLDLVVRERPHARADPRRHLDEALVRELAQRDPHGRHADAEPVGEVTVGEPLARSQRAVEDGVAHGRRDGLLDRPVLVDRQ